MNRKGIFLRAMKWRIDPDERNPEGISGVTITLAEIPSEPPSNPMKGYEINKYTTRDLNLFGEVDSKLAGSMVDLECDVIVRSGGKVKLVPLSVKKA